MALGWSVRRSTASALGNCRKRRCFGSTPIGRENLAKLAQALDRDPELCFELVEVLSKNSRIRMANSILDQEAKTGIKYSEFLSSRHRRKIMIREMSISMGKDVRDKMDANQDGHVSSEEMTEFLNNLLKTQEAATAKTPPTREQLFQLALLSGIPFVGFGFLDNAIMIIAGDMIDTNIGRVLGISTLAAAALGNWVSDVAGLGLGGYIEASSKRLGLKDPKLNLQQMNTRQVRILQFIATSIGITIGCFLGMLPLLFMDPEENDMKEMFEMMDLDEDGKVRVQQIVDLISDGQNMMGESNVSTLLQRIHTRFPDVEANIAYRDFKEFVVGVREEKAMESLSNTNHFLREFCDAVQLKRA